MEKKVTLFEQNSKSIHINIVAYFENGDFLIDGYDFGKGVEDFGGSDDYEYVARVARADIPKLSKALGLENYSEDEILKKVETDFQGNYSYSGFCRFLEEHEIENHGFRH